MQSGTRDAIFIGKLDKILDSLEWIQQNATEKQKQELVNTIKEALGPEIVVIQKEQS